ncbi:hypothetical protein C8259_27225 [Nocardia nova]|uniref:Uncharacterized protein n=1 Tax=Nocardia nova TaxID=37330 RepID=A0A2T2YVL0_9NOCA|nr:hypothetical protein C8259_27225 [Nocardia nova]
MSPTPSVSPIPPVSPTPSRSPAPQPLPTTYRSLGCLSRFARRRSSRSVWPWSASAAPSPRAGCPGRMSR